MTERIKVLIAYDGSDNARAALAELQRTGLPREVEAVVISAAHVDLPSVPSYEFSAMSVNERLSILLRARTQAFYNVVMKERERALLAVNDTLQLAHQAGEQIKAKFPAWEVRAEAYADSPASAVIKKANDWGADLIIVGTHGRSALCRLILGSVSQKVVNEAGCSVRVSRSQLHRDDSPVRLIVGLDGSAFAEKAACAVAARAWPAGSEVLLVTATTPGSLFGVAPEEPLKRAVEMHQTAGAMLREAGLTVTSVIKEGEAKGILIAEAESWRADSIFVGSRGLDSALKRFFLGSVSTAVVANATCSVEVVR
jgi:nucleotide-binding universal stress UspA family protein